MGLQGLRGVRLLGDRGYLEAPQDRRHPRTSRCAGGQARHRAGMRGGVRHPAGSGPPGPDRRSADRHRVEDLDDRAHAPGHVRSARAVAVVDDSRLGQPIAGARCAGTTHRARIAGAVEERWPAAVVARQVQAHRGDRPHRRRHHGAAGQLLRHAGRAGHRAARHPSRGPECAGAVCARRRSGRGARRSRRHPVDRTAIPAAIGQLARARFAWRVLPQSRLVG